jgi:hypothetical protein
MTTELAGRQKLRLQPLTFVDEGDDVMVGRPDIGSYGVFPSAGAELLKQLGSGTTLEDGAAWWLKTTGEHLDAADFLDTLEQLGFVVGEGEEPAPPVDVRWQRLAGWLFSPFAWLLYGALLVAGVVAMVQDPALRPTYRSFFFTEHITLIPLALALGQMPLLLLHEAYHALAARRRGLPSTLGIGRRYYYLVAETRLDALYSLPRRQRYLPFFAGSLVDAVGVACFTLAAAAGRHYGIPSWVSGLMLAFALSGLLRIAWQLMFYLETDAYFAINTASGCTDLHGASKYRVRRLLARLRRRELGAAHGTAEDWSERDHAAARWYAPLMAVGYGLSTVTLMVVALPAAWRFWSTVAERLVSPAQQSVGTLVDTAFFVAISLAQLGLFVYVTLRDRRQRATTPRA